MSDPEDGGVPIGNNIGIGPMVGEDFARCPSCDVMCTSSVSPDPMNNQKPTPMIMHPIPTCEYFDRTPADRIVDAMADNLRAKRSRNRGDA